MVKKTTVCVKVKSFSPQSYHLESAITLRRGYQLCSLLSNKCIPEYSLLDRNRLLDACTQLFLLGYIKFDFFLP